MIQSSAVAKKAHETTTKTNSILNFHNLVRMPPKKKRKLEASDSDVIKKRCRLDGERERDKERERERERGREEERKRERERVERLESWREFGDF